MAAVRAYELVPAWLERPIGWGLPFLEVSLGLLLVAGLFTRTAAAVSGLLFLAFLIAVVSAAARGLSIDCGCFGGGGQVAPGQSAYAGEIVRDARGEPTGLLIARPNATILYAALAKGPKLPAEYQKNSTRHFMREINRLGVTGVIDAGGGFQNYPDDYRIIEELHAEGQLTVELFSPCGRG